jgi:UDP-glucose 4-epimerase
MRSFEFCWIVTGGAGYIGSHVAHDLISAGNAVVVIDDLTTGNLKFIPSEAEFVHGSILDDTAINKAFTLARKKSKNIGIMHIAGVKLAGESVINPSKYWLINTVGTFKIASKAVEEKVSGFVFSSSCSVYGTVTNELVSENHGEQPESPYGRTKLASEHLLRDLLCGAGISCIALRYFNVVGTSISNVSDLSKANLFPAVLDSLNNGKPLTINGFDYETRDGTCVRDYLHVGDLSKGHLKAAEYCLMHENVFETINLGTGEGTSVLEIVQSFSEVLNKSILFEIGPRRDGDPISITADVTKSKKLLDWEAEFRLRDMVESSLNGWL